MKYLDYTGLQYFWNKLKAIFQTKQDMLVSGTNIKTVNGNSILGSGNIQAGDPDAVKYVSQTPTDAQKTQARTNIGAVAASAISALETAIAAKYSKPSGGIPETDLASGVQSAIALARTSIQSLTDYYSKTEVDALLDAVSSEQYVDVTTLPTASASTLGKIYLVGPDANGFYDRYYTSYDGSTYSWVAAGNTEINLANYATKEELSQLRHDLTESVEYSDATLEPFTSGKYIYWQYGYQWPKATATIGGLIPLKAGQTIKVNIPQIVDANTIAIAVLKPNGVDFYPSDQAGVRSVTGQSDYEYTAETDCQVSVCYTTAGGYSAVVPGDFITQKVTDLTDEVHEISESIGDIGGTAESAKDALDGYTAITPEVAETDKGLHYSYKKIVNATGFLYTKPIWLNKGDTIKMVLSGGNPHGLYSAIARLIYDGMNYSLLVGQVGNVFEYQWTALYDTYIALCYPSASVATVTVKRVAVPEHISRVDPAEPIIVAPYHNEPADGTDGSIFNAETVTADELDAEAQNIVRNYPGVFNREVMGRDASGTYDIARYIFTKRDFFAYKAADGLFAWKSGDTLVYTSSVCPVAGDTVYDSGRAEIGVVGSYNSTNSEMTVSDVAYIRSWEDNIQPDVVFLNYDLAESVRAFTYLIHPLQAYRYVVDAKKRNLGEWTADNYNTSTGVFTWDGKSYVRDKSFDFGDTQKHTIVLWGNEHAPQRDPAEPAITLLKMMRDLASSRADDNPLLRYIKYHCKVVFIPCANPWGMTRHTTTPSYSGETNYNGVNINRNYDFQWESVTALKGAAAGDQPETRFLMDTCGIFGADLAMDIHCLGYNSYINRVCYDAVLPDGGLEKARQEMQRGYNKYFSTINGENAQSPGEGSGFICHTLGIGGGLIEMNAGIPNETLHCSGIMQMNYDFLLKMIRLFLQITDPDLYITR